MGTMMAQVSVYPLRQSALGPSIRAALRAFQWHQLTVRVGEMSTLLCGEEKELFDALQEAFHLAAELGDMVMTVTLSNACPTSREMDSPSSKDW